MENSGIIDFIALTVSSFTLEKKVPNTLLSMPSTIFVCMHYADLLRDKSK